MRLPRFQFTIRRMLLLIAIMAVLIVLGRWVDRWAHDRYRGQTFVKTYYVGDLVTSNGQMPAEPVSMAKLDDEAALLKSSVMPYVWWFGNGSVQPFALANCLIVRQTEAGHRAIGEWLRERRKALDAGR